MGSLDFRKRGCRAASIFGQAIYPTLFVFYLKQFRGLAWETTNLCRLFVVVTCRDLNLPEFACGNTSAVAILPVSRRSQRLCDARQNGPGGSYGGRRYRVGCFGVLWHVTTWDGIRFALRRSRAAQRTIRGDDCAVVW